MRPMRLWVGLVLVTIGEFGLLDVSDILSWSMTVGRWWPAALIAVGVAAMVTQRRVSFGPAIMTGIGVVLLAGRLGWLESRATGPVLIVLIGVAILLSSVGRIGRPRVRTKASARWHCSGGVRSKIAPST
jgi:hypothetical protein